MENILLATQVIAKIASPLFTGEGLFILTVFGLAILLFTKTFKQA